MPYPFHNESERDYCAWLGLYIKAFASMEAMIYFLLADYAQHGLIAGFKPAQPVSLDTKLRHLISAAGQPRLAPERDELLALADFVANEKDFRHDLVHGIDARFRRADPHFSLMWRPELTAGKPPAIPDVTTSRELEDHHSAVGPVSLAFLTLRLRLKDGESFASSV